MFNLSGRLKPVLLYTHMICDICNLYIVSVHLTTSYDSTSTMVDMIVKYLAPIMRNHNLYGSRSTDDIIHQVHR